MSAHTQAEQHEQHRHYGTRRWTQVARLAVAIALFAVVALCAPPTGTARAAGQSYIVTTLLDNATGAVCTSSCTLRQAINASNANDPNMGFSNAITFAAGLTGTITLTPTGAGYGVLGLSRSVSITGPVGASGVTINGNNKMQLFVVNNGITATFTNLTITGGTSTGTGGGALANSGTLIVASSVFTSNTTTTVNGGAILNTGTLTITGSTFAGNTATNSGGGGALFNSGTATITGSTFTGNTAPMTTGSGGAIYNDLGESLTITNSTFTGNTSNNKGGAIYNLFNAPLAVVGSTFTGNHAGTGGGIYAYGPLRLTLSVLAGNTAGNATSGPDLLGTITTDGGGNMIGSTDSASGFTAASNRLNVAPLLAAPALNAPGTVQTVALLPGSPAINIAPCTYTDSNSMTQTLTADARGITRPQPMSSTCDAGAFESRGFALSTPTGNGQSTAPNSAFPVALAITVAPVAAGEPVATGQVAFTIIAGSGGASGTFTNAGCTVTTGNTVAACAVGVNGTATAPTITANGTSGTFTVVASTAGVTTPTTYTLINVSPSPQNFIVTNTTDAVNNSACNTSANGGCTLRQAINASNITSGTAANTIAFDPAAFAVARTVTLTAANSTLTLSHAVTITGPTGVARVTLNGGCTDCAPGGAGTNGTGIRILLVDSDITATLADLTIANGHVRITDPGSASGGGIRNNGALTVTNCAFVNNRSDSTGAGIDANTGTLTVTGSIFTGNTAQSGAGLYNGSQTTVTDSIFTGNTAQSGAGLHNGGDATVRGSTFSGNTASDSGGGLYNNDHATVVNSTFSGNTASNHGGGFHNGYVATVVNNTFSGNTAPDGGGIYRLNSFSLTATNNLIVNSLGGGDVSGFTPDSTNRTGTFAFADATPANHGGPVPTLALPPGSPAIDVGTCNPIYTDVVTNTTATVTTDARGIARPQLAGGGCDIGAFESQGFTLASPTGGTQSATVTTAFAAPLILTVSSSHTEPITGGTITFAITPGAGGVNAASASFTTTGTTCTVSADRLSAVCPVNSSGLATSPTLKAGPNTGTFTVVGSTTGVPVAGNATYTLTNTSSAGLITPQPNRAPNGTAPSGTATGIPAPQPTPKATATGTPAGTIAPQPVRR